jgi:hypothetical protein
MKPKRNYAQMHMKEILNAFDTYAQQRKEAYIESSRSVDFYTKIVTAFIILFLICISIVMIKLTVDFLFGAY